ncbi:MAG: VWA domain-containing protein [Burkholderiaceae bacterium]
MTVTAEPSHALGDARTGKMPGNVLGFCRALRRAGLTLDSARIALSIKALDTVGLQNRGDVAAALESVLVHRGQDRFIFRELFDAYFRDPKMANQLLAQMLPTAQGQSAPDNRRARVREALNPPKIAPKDSPPQSETPIELDAAMTASEANRLRYADFNTLTASEYQLISQLVQDIPLPLPKWRSRRLQASPRGSRLDWGKLLRQSAQGYGVPPKLPRRARKDMPPQLLIFVDVSGSMERYARLLLAFLHAATQAKPGGRVMPVRHVFAFGTQLTPLTQAFNEGDADAMFAHVNQCVSDFAGGTQLGQSLEQFQRGHGRILSSGRTVCLIISDGLDTGSDTVLEQALNWLKLRSDRLLWLNPLLRFEQYTPTARGATVLSRNVDAMLAVHNVDSLKMLAQSIAAVMRA